MKRRWFRKIKLRSVNVQDIDARLLLINLYMTQGLLFLIAIGIIWWQKISMADMFSPLPDAGVTVITYGVLCAGLVLFTDFALARFIPEHVTDDGGVNEKIFAGRPVWHTAVLCLVIAVCEELLFRGAVQHMIGAYWTSVLFAAIHVRYLQHWLMTSLVFGISYALGWIYMQTGTLLTPILAHFIIDFVLGYYLRGGKKNG